MPILAECERLGLGLEVEEVEVVGTALAVVEADVEGYARTHIIFPATIYGIAEGALFDAGVSYPHSVQLPYLIKAALARKSAGIVGMENALWPNVHIHDGTSPPRSYQLRIH